jgi:3-oxoacyl-[acyl-carrier-protein] synthase-3
MLKSAIKGTGSFLPLKIMANKELEKIIHTTDEWIISRTGIKQRHIASNLNEDCESVAHMAAKAGKVAIDNAGINIDEIDLIIVATTTAEKTFPATAVIAQEILGIKQGAAFDIQAVCAGFVFALSIADCMIKSGGIKNALVIGADKMSSIVNWSDRSSCILFGDGAGAVVLSASNDGASGLIGFDINSDGNFKDILYTDGGVSSTGTSGKLVMLGKEVFKHAVDKMGESLKKLLEKTNITSSQIDWLVPHQANERIIDALAQRLDFPIEKVIRTVGIHANTSAASIPLALHSAVCSGQIKTGDLVASTAIGGGLSWGSYILRL